MSEKNPPSASPSQPSASDLPASDRSLERVLGAIAKTIASFETVAQMIYTEVTAQGKLNMQRHEAAVKLLSKMRLELATLTDQLRTLVQSHNIQLGATNEARDALIRTSEKLEDAVEDITGSHKLLNPEDEDGAAPHAVRTFAVKAANFIWPIAMRTGREAALWGVKLLAGSTALAGLAKILHDLIVGG